MEVLLSSASLETWLTLRITWVSNQPSMSVWSMSFQIMCEQLTSESRWHPQVLKPRHWCNSPGSPQVKKNPRRFSDCGLCVIWLKFGPHNLFESERWYNCSSDIIRRYVCRRSSASPPSSAGRRRSMPNASLTPTLPVSIGLSHG